MSTTACFAFLKNAHSGAPRKKSLSLSLSENRENRENENARSGASRKSPKIVTKPVKENSFLLAFSRLYGKQVLIFSLQLFFSVNKTRPGLANPVLSRTDACSEDFGCIFI